MKTQHIFLLSAVFLLIIINLVFADTQIRRGYIINEDGIKCWYAQEIAEEYAYFYGDMPGKLNIMTFESKNCIKNTDLNKTIINNVISRWYSHEDANFQTNIEDVYPGSLMQKKGVCIQSKTYPMAGIMIDYITENNYIIKVLHTMAVSGCVK